jgi:hypothetical protein
MHRHLDARGEHMAQALQDVVFIRIPAALWSRWRPVDLLRTQRANRIDARGADRG